MNDESRTSLAAFIANVAMLTQAIRKDATRDQIMARVGLMDANAIALADVLAKEDRSSADAVKEAWEQPAKVIAKAAARITRQ